MSWIKPNSSLNYTKLDGHTEWPQLILPTGVKQWWKITRKSLQEKKQQGHLKFSLDINLKPVHML